MLARTRHSAAFAVATLFLVACGGAHRPAAEEAIARAYDATRVMHTGFVAWDERHQLDLVAAAPDRPAGEAALAAYRARREKAVAAFVVAYGALGAASAALAADRDLGRALSEAADATRALYLAVQELRGP